MIAGRPSFGNSCCPARGCIKREQSIIGQMPQRNQTFDISRTLLGHQLLEYHLWPNSTAPTERISSSIQL